MNRLMVYLSDEKNCVNFIRILVLGVFALSLISQIIFKYFGWHTIHPSILQIFIVAILLLLSNRIGKGLSKFLRKDLEK